MHLSSCYFCGTALDDPVSEYPVVPDEIDPADGPTVALCPSCRRKLSTVLDAVFESLDDADGVATTLDEYDGVEPEGADSTDEDRGGTADDEQSSGPTIVSTPEPVVESAESAESATDGPPVDATASADGTDAEAAGTATDSRPNGSETTDDEGETRPAEAEADDDSEAVQESETDGEDDPDVAESEDGDADHGTEESDQQTATTEGADGADHEDVAADADDETDDESPPADEQSSADADDGSADGEQPSILSTPAAKKVVRLLQNRSFPVDRTEFQTVAANAYDIPPQDCEDVVDALVEGGYVGEEDGRLVRPAE